LAIDLGYDTIIPVFKLFCWNKHDAITFRNTGYVFRNSIYVIPYTVYR